MANTNNPFGARPVRYLNGTPWTGQARPYYVPAGYATALFIGDPVVIVGDANDNEVNGFPPGTLSEINIAVGADATAFTGFITGFLPVTAESPIYRAASTERIAFVADDPNLIFHMQDDGSGTPSIDNVGLNADMVSGSGSTATGRSGWALLGSSLAADASSQLNVLSLARHIADNDIDSDYAIWEVTINQQTYRASGADRGLGIA